MTFKNELWVFDNLGKRKYDITYELITNILKSMEDLYCEWIIDFMREHADEWHKSIFIAVIDGELHNLQSFKTESEGISFMKSLLRNNKIKNILKQ